MDDIQDKASGLVRSYLDSWNQGSPEALARFFTPDGDLIAADGKHVRGVPAIGEYYRNALSGSPGSFRLLNFKLWSSRQLGAGVVLVDGAWEVHVPSQGGAPSQSVAAPVGTFVVDTSGSDWKIAAARIYVPMKIG